ncbi:tail protein [Pseudomonas phage PhiPA3]|uniref:Virion structural protein n=1 Tax=Pseudomonas phage PhiPA3 TaxID=998086 RepID=F8SK24_BPPA3|nr:tail protein [Pseudomonas phage PhiPA3]AEH03574.1 virion structural protein [Pseudomonas phage PhiPA3]
MAIADFRVKLEFLKGVLSNYQNLITNKFATVRDRLNAHTSATGNVHDMEAEDIGLGQVPNYPPATTQQATDGISNNSLMTPKRVDDYVATNIFQVIETAFNDAADRL